MVERYFHSAASAAGTRQLFFWSNPRTESGRGNPSCSCSCVEAASLCCIALMCEGSCGRLRFASIWLCLLFPYRGRRRLLRRSAAGRPQFRRGLPRLPRWNCDAVHWFWQYFLSFIVYRAGGERFVARQFVLTASFALSFSRCVRARSFLDGGRLNCHDIVSLSSFCFLAGQGRSTGPAVCIQGQTVSVSLPNLVPTVPGQSVPAIFGKPPTHCWLAVSVCVHL